MSDDSLPASTGRYNPLNILDENLTIREVFGVLRVGGPPLQPSDTTPQPRQPRPPRKSGLYVVLHAIQQHGITHPKDGYFLMLPKEFKAILALEQKAVAQVVFEVFDQTIGRVGGDQGGRQEWAPLSVRYFVRAGILSRSQAEMGIKQALTKGYIVRRQRGAQLYEYAIRWRGTN